MKAKMGNKIVEVWRVTTDGPRPDWIQQKFDSGTAKWDTHYPFILGFGGRDVDARGFGVQAGDYVILDDGLLRGINEKSFQKHFELFKEYSFI